MAKNKKTAPAVKADSGLFIIEGEGVVPIYVDGEMHRLLRGTAIEITPEDQAHLTREGVLFAPAKSEK